MSYKELEERLSIMKQALSVDGMPVKYYRDIHKAIRELKKQLLMYCPECKEKGTIYSDNVMQCKNKHKWFRK